MLKTMRQTVSALIRTLTAEGYAAAKTRGEGAVTGFDILYQNFRVALRLAKKFDVHRNTIDFILRDYVAHSKRTSWIMHTIELPSPNMMLEFAHLGASRPAVELLAKEFARQGSISAFLTAIRMLNRKPDEAEINMLVNDYLNGPTGGSEMSEMQEKLIELAKGVSRELGEHVSTQLAERRRRLALCCD